MSVWTALAALGALALILQICYFAIVARALARLPRVPPVPEGARPLPRVRVIVPMFDEQDNAVACVRSLAAQFASDAPEGQRLSGGVLVVDDGSTDATPSLLASLAREFPDVVRVVRTAARPASPPAARYVGKNWACSTAARLLEPEDDWVCFVDADVRLRPGALSRALHHAVDTQTDLLTLVPSVRCGCLAERLVQPVMVGMMAALFRPDAVNDPRSKLAFAAGPFLLFRRAFYDGLGGHDAIASEVVDDVALARLTKANGGRLRLASGAVGEVDGDELCSVRMYGDFASLWEGWTKNVFLGLERSVVRAAVVIAFVLGVFLLPFLTFAAALAAWTVDVTGPLPALALGSIAIAWAVRRLLARRLRLDTVGFALTPVGALIVTAIVMASAWRVTSGRGWTWKGRSLGPPPPNA